MCYLILIPMILSLYIIVATLAATITWTERFLIGSLSVGISIRNFGNIIHLFRTPQSHRTLKAWKAHRIYNMKHSQSLQYQANKARIRCSDVRRIWASLAQNSCPRSTRHLDCSFLIEDKCTWQSVHLSLDPEQCIFAALHNMEKSNENTNLLHVICVEKIFSW